MSLRARYYLIAGGPAMEHSERHIGLARRHQARPLIVHIAAKLETPMVSKPTRDDAAANDDKATPHQPPHPPPQPAFA